MNPERKFTLIPGLDNQTGDKAKEAAIKAALEKANENMANQSDTEELSERTFVQLYRDFSNDLETIREKFSKGEDISLECETTMEQIEKQIELASNAQDKGTLATLFDEVKKFSDWSEKTYKKASNQ